MSKRFSSKVRRQKVLGIELVNGLHCLFRSVNNAKQIEVVGVDHIFGDQCFFHPVNKPFPEFLSYHNDRKLSDLFCLDKRQGFAEFVERSESSGHNDKSLRVFHEHRLAHEEVVERDQFVFINVNVALLLKGEEDIQTY